MRRRWPPSKGDSVHVEDAIPEQRNGIIQYINWNTKEVVVAFPHKRETYDWDEMRGAWTDRYGGVWMLDR